MAGKKLVEGYKPVGHGIFKAGEASYKIGLPRKSTIEVEKEDQRFNMMLEDVPEKIVNMANEGRKGGESSEGKGGGGKGGQMSEATN